MLPDAAPASGTPIVSLGVLALLCFCALVLTSAVVTAILLVRHNRRKSS